MIRADLWPHSIKYLRTKLLGIIIDFYETAICEIQSIYPYRRVFLSSLNLGCLSPQVSTLVMRLGWLSPGRYMRDMWLPSSRLSGLNINSYYCVGLGPK